MLKDDLKKGKETFEEVFKNVKFDVVVGNPPYQEEGEARNEPIYHHFMELAYNVADKAVLITPARFLFNAGQTPKAWNKKMLEDNHLKVVYYAQKSEEVFPNTAIMGGVVVTYRDINENFGGIGVFTAHKEIYNIVEKVENSKKFESFSKLVYPLKVV